MLNNRAIQLLSRVRASSSSTRVGGSSSSSSSSVGDSSNTTTVTSGGGSGSGGTTASWTDALNAFPTTWTRKRRRGGTNGEGEKWNETNNITHTSTGKINK